MGAGLRLLFVLFCFFVFRFVWLGLGGASGGRAGRFEGDLQDAVAERVAVERLDGHQSLGFIKQNRNDKSFLPPSLSVATSLAPARAPAEGTESSGSNWVLIGTAGVWLFSACGETNLVVVGHGDESKALALVGLQVADDFDRLDGAERAEQLPQHRLLRVRSQIVHEYTPTCSSSNHNNNHNSQETTSKQDPVPSVGFVQRPTDGTEHTPTRLSRWTPTHFFRVGFVQRPTGGAEHPPQPQRLTKRTPTNFAPFWLFGFVFFCGSLQELS